MTATEHLRLERAIVAAAFGDSISPDDGFDLDPVLRQYRQAITQLVTCADSDEGRIRLTTRGMVSWEVRIATGTVRQRSESEFLAQLHGAIGNLFADYQGKVMVIRDDLYDLGWSERSRRASGFGMRRDPGRAAR